MISHLVESDHPQPAAKGILGLDVAEVADVRCHGAKDLLEHILDLLSR
jgi:hypothetical protein